MLIWFFMKEKFILIKMEKLLKENKILNGSLTTIIYKN